jgi:hypothetical protein
MLPEVLPSHESTDLGADPISSDRAREHVLGAWFAQNDHLSAAKSSLTTAIRELLGVGTPPI